MKKTFNVIVAVSFAVYIMACFYLLFMRLGGVQRVSAGLTAYNLVPFETISGYLRILAYGSGYALMNLVGNILIFLPLGFYLPFFSKKMGKIIIYTLFMALLIVFVETAQFITGVGSLDVDDFILNLTGALFGFLVCKLTPIRRLLK